MQNMRKELRYEQRGETKKRVFIIGQPAPGLDHLYFQMQFLNSVYGMTLNHEDSIWLSEQKKLADSKGLSLEEYLMRLEEQQDV